MSLRCEMTKNCYSEARKNNILESLMKKILIDSGPLIALFDRNDKYHLATVEFIKSNNCELVTALASVTETLHLLDFNRNAQIDFLGWVNAGAVTLETITLIDLQRIKELKLQEQ